MIFFGLIIYILLTGCLPLTSSAVNNLSLDMLGEIIRRIPAAPLEGDLLHEASKSVPKNQQREAAHTVGLLPSKSIHQWIKDRLQMVEAAIDTQEKLDILMQAYGHVPIISLNIRTTDLSLAGAPNCQWTYLKICNKKRKGEFSFFIRAGVPIEQLEIGGDIKLLGDLSYLKKYKGPIRPFLFSVKDTLTDLNLSTKEMINFDPAHFLHLQKLKIEGPSLSVRNEPGIPNRLNCRFMHINVNTLRAVFDCPALEELHIYLSGGISINYFSTWQMPNLKFLSLRFTHPSMHHADFFHNLPYNCPALKCVECIDPLGKKPENFPLYIDYLARISPYGRSGLCREEGRLNF